MARYKSKKLEHLPTYFIYHLIFICLSLHLAMQHGTDKTTVQNIFNIYNKRIYLININILQLLDKVAYS